jgi:aminoglycoside phosphotransferase (APT) family kinase protein
VAEEISELVEPRLAHRDLYLDNVLVGDHGRISAIIDLDLAEAWDPVVDFVKPRSQVFPLIPGAEEAFEAGYAETAGGLPAAFEQRVRVVEVLELSNHVVNCIAGGKAEYAAHNRHRLEAVLAAAW